MTVRMVQWQPYCVKKPFDSKTPVCAACKRTNRTRSFCRDRHKHRHLPWCTVYVLLSSLESADPNTVVAGPSTKAEGGDENGETEGKGKSGDDEEEDQKPKAATASEGESSRNDAETISSDAGDEGDDINDIPESRTFLAKVSCRSISIHWLELAEFDSSEATAFPGGIPQPDAAQHFHPAMMAAGGGIDPSNASYYGPGMGYAAQQHQNALKSRQQYFFQMQQHQQQQYASQQQGQWHHPYGPQQGQEGQHPGATAGEAAAVAQQQQQQQRRGMTEAEMQSPQPWAVYYAPPPPHGNYPPHPHGHEGAGGSGEHHHHHHEGDQYNAHHDAETEEPDGKRQRV